MQPVQPKISRHTSAICSWSALFAIQSVHILKFSLKMLNGFVQNEKWASPFKIFSVDGASQHHQLQTDTQTSDNVLINTKIIK
jgi:hypothetical protein